MADAVVHRLPTLEPVAVVRIVDEERQVRGAAHRSPAPQRAVAVRDREVEDLDPVSSCDRLEVVGEYSPREEPVAGSLACERPAAALTDLPRQRDSRSRALQGSPCRSRSSRAATAASGTSATT